MQLGANMYGTVLGKGWGAKRSQVISKSGTTTAPFFIASPALAGRFFTTEPTGKPILLLVPYFYNLPLSSVAQSCPTLCDPMDCSTPGLPVHHQLPEFTQTLVHLVGDAIQPSHPLSSLLLLPSIFPSIRVFSNESILHIRLPKYWSFSFNISPSKEYSGLVSIKMDWLDLLAVQGTLKSLLQHHSPKASVLWCSVFFTVQLSHPYMTTGKTVAFPLTPKLRVTYPSVLF